MPLIELLILKLALAGIIQNANEIAHEQDSSRKQRELKSQLSQLMIDYESGAIDQDTYNKREFEIMSKLGGISKQYDV
jgi:hypothetical protein